MACTKCNAPEKKCNQCNGFHLECNPCYQLEKTCTTTEATPIDPCINPEYCSDGCAETHSSDCIATPCGTLTEALALLINPDTCEPYATGDIECEPLGGPTTLEVCIEAAPLDIKAGFLSANAGVDTTGIITFLSGPATISQDNSIFPVTGTYTFAYIIHNPCLAAQIITVNVVDCFDIELILGEVDCQDGTLMIAGTYTTNGSTPTLVLTSGQTATNVVIDNGTVTFELEDIDLNQILSFYLTNETQSNTVDVALQICEECLINITEIHGGCANELSAVSETNELYEQVDIELLADSIVFNTNWKCVMDVCGTATTTSQTQINKLETHVGLDYSGFIDGISYIKSVTLHSNLTGPFTIDLDPTSNANPLLLYDASNVPAWRTAVTNQLLANLATAGFSTLDYQFFTFNSGTTLRLNFRIKHQAVGEWIGFEPGTPSLNYVISGVATQQVEADFLNTDFSITCSDTDACGNNLSISYNVILDNVDFNNTTYNNIVLFDTTSTITPIGTSDNTSFCDLEVTLAANFTGCLGATYLWSTGDTTATINDVPPGVYTVTATCDDCTATASYELVADIDCNSIPFIEYDCRTIFTSNDFDSITIAGIGEVTNNQDIWIPNGNYPVTFVKAGCPDKTQTLVVDCIPHWEVTEDVSGFQVCQTTFNLAPTNANDLFTITFINNPPIASLFVSYTVADVGIIYTFDNAHSIRFDSIDPDGVVTFSQFSTLGTGFVTDVKDFSLNSSNASLVNPTELC